MGVSQKTIRAIGARGRPAVGSKLRVHPVQLGAEVRSLLAGALHVPAHERRREQEIDGDRDQPQQRPDRTMRAVPRCGALAVEIACSRHGRPPPPL